MLTKLYQKLTKATLSVLPLTLIVLIISFTPMVKVSSTDTIIFVISAILLILGIALFNLGTEMAMSPMGEKIGTSLTKTRKLPLILLVAFFMGVIITMAEGDLTIVSGQIQKAISPEILITVTGIGVGIFFTFSVLKIIFKKDLSNLLFFFYMIMFAFISIAAINEKANFIPISLDAGGIVSGPLLVPFIMSLGVGIASTVGGKRSNENSFGFIALCSFGPILAFLLLANFIDLNNLSDVANPSQYVIAGSVSEFFKEYGLFALKQAKRLVIALGIIYITFLIIQSIYIKLPKRKLGQIFIGVIYTFIGLVLFISASGVGYWPFGHKIGTCLANDGNIWLLVIFGFILGLSIVLAEPAVHVLTKQVEETTTGGVSKKELLTALSIGVGLSLALAVIRTVYDFSILYYLVPGYVISLALSFFVPKIYTAIAFDSGGVATGPITTSFLLPFAVGVCSVVQPDSVLENGFGIIAMVAMTPLITIQLLGFKSILKRRVKEVKHKKAIIDASDEVIINFN